jgi:hypothetical protein
MLTSDKIVEGIIRSPDGRPIKGVNVKLFSGRVEFPLFRFFNPFLGEMLTDDEGRFAFKVKDYGKYVLKIGHGKGRKVYKTINFVKPNKFLITIDPSGQIK